MSLTFRRSWIVLLSCVALGLAALAGCGTPTPPQPDIVAPASEGTDSATPPPGGRGEIQGSGAPSDSSLRLYEGTCPPASTAAADSATSDSNGTFTFTNASTSVTTYCVDWQTGYMVCKCDWSNDECTCSP